MKPISQSKTAAHPKNDGKFNLKSSENQKKLEVDPPQLIPFVNPSKTAAHPKQNEKFILKSSENQKNIDVDPSLLKFISKSKPSAQSEAQSAKRHLKMDENPIQITKKVKKAEKNIRENYLNGKHNIYFILIKIHFNKMFCTFRK